MTSLKAPIFKGIATALITPFLDNGDIDFDSLARLIDIQLESNVSALVVCGTTGEAPTLSAREQLSLIEFAVNRVNGRIPVIAGAGSNYTKKAIALSRNAEMVGADALLSVTPYYNKASNDGLILHYLSIANKINSPMILYNVPSRTGVDIPLDVYKVLARHKRIVALKEARGNTETADKLRASGTDLHLYSGNDLGLCDMLDTGALGCISVASNIIPKEMVQLCDLYFSGRKSEARELEKTLSPLFSALFCEVNPIPVKHALYTIGLCLPTMRLPLCPPSAFSAAAIDKAIKDLGLI